MLLYRLGGNCGCTPKPWREEALGKAFDWYRPGIEHAVRSCDHACVATDTDPGPPLAAFLPTSRTAKTLPYRTTLRWAPPREESGRGRTPAWTLRNAGDGPARPSQSALALPRRGPASPHRGPRLAALRWRAAQPSLAAASGRGGSAPAWRVGTRTNDSTRPASLWRLLREWVTLRRTREGWQPPDCAHAGLRPLT